MDMDMDMDMDKDRDNETISPRSSPVRAITPIKKPLLFLVSELAPLGRKGALERCGSRMRGKSRRKDATAKGRFRQQSRAGLMRMRLRNARVFPVFETINNL